MALTDKQKEVYDFIRSYADTHGYAPTQKEIKEHFELKSFGSVQRYIKYLVDAGLIECDWNARRGLKLVDENEGHISSTPQDAAEIPLLGKVAAGIPIEALAHPDETIKVPLEMLRSSGQHFALRVRGSSMIEDGILNNDIIVCKVQQKAEQGQTVVALIEGEATVKRFYKKQNRIELHPANSEMVPIIVEDGNFNIAGIVVGLLRRYD